MSETRWVRTRPGNAYSWEEEKPYRECPNCGRYKFRKLRLLHRGIIRTFILGEDPYYTYDELCKDCGYKSERWTETK